MVCAGLLAACGTGSTALSGAHHTQTAASSSSATTAPPVGSGYVATGSDFVDFIQWNDNDGKLTGTAQSVTTSGQTPNMTTAGNSINVTGTISGSSISLSFNYGTLTFGTLSGGSFTLDFPQSDGSLAPVTFTSASATRFDQDLASLKGQVAQSNQAEVNAQNLAKQEQTINGDATAVANDIGNISGAASQANSDAHGVQSSLGGEATELSDTQSAEAQVATEAQAGPDGSGTDVCGDAEDVGGDAQDVAGDAQDLEGSAESVTNDVASIHGDVSQLNTDFATFQSDQAGLPSYSPPSPPTQDQVSQAAAGGSASAASVVTTTNGYIAQANADVTTAYQYAAEAYQAGNCGPAPTAPQPQADIS